MNFTKIIIYLSLTLIMVSPWDHENLRLVFFIFLGMIYYDAKDVNIRSLVVVVAMVEFIFYELDYLFYVISKYYWVTGPIAGDIILDIIILLSIVFTMASIYYRCEIIDLISPVWNLERFEYMPTRADLAVLNAMRVIGLYHIVMLIFKIMLILDYNEAIETGRAAEVGSIYEELITFGKVYVDWGFRVELIKYIALLTTLHAWLKKSLKSSRSKFSVMDM